jgi:hypothetical protein
MNPIYRCCAYIWLFEFQSVCQTTSEQLEWKFLMAQDATRQKWIYNGKVRLKQKDNKRKILQSNCEYVFVKRVLCSLFLPIRRPTAFLLSL